MRQPGGGGTGKLGPGVRLNRLKETIAASGEGSKKNEVKTAVGRPKGHREKEERWLRGRGHLTYKSAEKRTHPSVLDAGTKEERSG